MHRNPFSRIRQETARMTQRATLTPAKQAQTSGAELGVLEAGYIDPATGTLTPYGQLDVTPLDDSDGFLLR